MTDKKENDWNEVFDVIVVGSGFAGMAAAIEALKHGAHVLVVEKMPSAGGNSVIDSGELAVVGSPQQAKRRIRDSAGLLAEDMLENGAHLNDPVKVRYVTEHSRDIYEWITGLGVRWADGVAGAGGHSIPRILFTASGSGQEIHAALFRLFTSLGGELRTSCYVEQIIREEDARGTAAGLVVREGYNFPDSTSGVSRRIWAARAVILCHGGFAADTEYRQTVNSSLTPDLSTTNQPGATAEMWRETARIGCQILSAGWVQSTPWNNPKEDGQGIAWLFSEYAPAQFGFWVTSEGCRFVDETANRKVRTDAIFEEHRQGHRVWCVASADSAAFLDTIYESFTDKVLSLGLVSEANTIAEVEQKIGIKPGALSAELDQFNAVIMEKRKDRFGRNLRRMKPVSGKKWFFAEMTPKVHHCMGGVMTNPDGAVLDARTQRPIPGLFAAGECAGGVHGVCRITACAILDCLVMGRLAGAKACGAEPDYTN